jgi:hypothetical protein
LFTTTLVEDGSLDELLISSTNPKLVVYLRSSSTYNCPNSPIYSSRYFSIKNNSASSSILKILSSSQNVYGFKLDSNSYAEFGNISFDFNISQSNFLSASSSATFLLSDSITPPLKIIICYIYFLFYLNINDKIINSFDRII